MIIERKIKECRELMKERDIIISKVENNECTFKDIEKELNELSVNIEIIIKKLNNVFRG